MPQANIFSSFKNTLNKLVPALVDSNTNQSLVSKGGALTSLNNTAAKVIKASAGRVGKIIIIAPGSTSGAFTINDSATTGGASAANLLWTLPYNGTANVAGAVFDIDLPFTNGLVISAVPGAGSPIINISYT